MDKERIISNIVIGTPIKIKKLGHIKIIKVEDVVKIGFNKLFEYLYILSTRVSDIDENGDLVEVSNFELINFDKLYKKKVLEAIKFFVQNEVNYFEEQNFIGIGKGRIDAENYDDFVEAIMIMCCFSRPKNKKNIKDMTPEQRKVYEKIMMHRKIKAEKEGINFSDILMLVQYGSDYLITSNELKEMSYFELRKRLDVLIMKEKSDIFLAYKTSAKYDVKENEPLWIEAFLKSNKESVNK